MLHRQRPVPPLPPSSPARPRRAPWPARVARSLPLLAAALALSPQAWAQDTGPARVGLWSPVTSWPLVAVHMTVLPSGKLLLWPRDGGAQARLYDPTTGTFSRVPVAGANIFCSGHALLPDGRVLVAGGHVDDGVGLRTARIFDGESGGWTGVGGPMNNRRWYPTVTTLPSGEMLVVGGNIDNSLGANTLPQVLDSFGEWRSLTGARLDLPLYPFLHVAPNGRVFNSGPGTTSRYLSTAGRGAWSTVATSSTYRDYGSSVQYADSKILLLGGHDPPVATAEVIDLAQPAPAWRPVAPMAHARRQLNATLLPDGKVLVTGGTSSGGFNDATGAVLATELWDPAAETFSPMAPAAERRLYHSTAVLLPDGRVLSAGGGEPAATGGDRDHPTMEIFSPPYLFRGARPVITWAPGSVGYGQTFFLETPDGAAVAQVTLLRLSSVTHSFNENQRIHRPGFVRASGGLQVTMPAGPNVCPPGDYLLFLLNGSGVPSIATFINIS